jgi:beta-galactosidase/beta-glucuronidase
MELLVGVHDPTTGVCGKQSRNPQHCTYTSSSGIWATVWLEAVPSTHIDAVIPLPHADLTGFDFEIDTSGPVLPGSAVVVNVSGCGDGAVASGRASANGNSKTVVTVGLPMNCREPWSPARPFLYNTTVRLINTGAVAGVTTVMDSVGSYAGLRTYTVGDDGKGVSRPLLNGKFVYQMATLDQGFWPDGNYAAPNDAALRSDLEALKAMGFNAVRKHMKVEPRRWYYHADVLGLMVWQDMPGTTGALRRNV